MSTAKHGSHHDIDTVLVQVAKSAPDNQGIEVMTWDRGNGEPGSYRAEIGVMRSCPFRLSRVLSDCDTTAIRVLTRPW